MPSSDERQQLTPRMQFVLPSNLFVNEGRGSVSGYRLKSGARGDMVYATLVKMAKALARYAKTRERATTYRPGRSCRDVVIKEIPVHISLYRVVPRYAYVGLLAVSIAAYMIWRFSWLLRGARRGDTRGDATRRDVGE